MSFPYIEAVSLKKFPEYRDYFAVISEPFGMLFGLINFE